MLENTRPIWRPYTQELTTPPALKIRSASGSRLVTEHGQSLLDAISSWWVITHGHCHPEIAAAIAKQASEVDQVLFANFTHEPAEELGELLLAAAPPAFKKVFLTDNGSTAVEVALKIALQACAQKDQPERRRFLTFTHSYHGDTAGAMSVSGQSLYTRPYKSMLFDSIHARQATLSTASADEYVEDALLQLQTYGHEIAAVVIEPLLQGAGGMIVWPAEAVRRLVKAAREAGAFVIFDEVLTGFGRTGTLFAMNQLDVVPDLVCFSKGLTGGALPLGATLATQELYDLFLHQDKSRMLLHGHSFSGNPMACAAAVANLKIFRRENVEEKLRRIADYHRQRIAALPAGLPIRDVRHCGTIAAIEIATDDAGYGSNLGDHVREFALKHSVFLRPLGNVVYFMPPYSTSPEDLKLGWDVIESAVAN